MVEALNMIAGLFWVFYTLVMPVEGDARGLPRSPALRLGCVIPSAGGGVEQRALSPLVVSG